MSYKAASKPLVSVRARVNMLLLIVVSALGYIGFGEFVEYRDQVLEEEKVLASAVKSAPVQKSEQWDRVLSLVVAPDQWKKYKLPRSRKQYIIQFECLSEGFIKASKNGKTYRCNKDTKDQWIGDLGKEVYFISREERLMTVAVRIKYD